MISNAVNFKSDEFIALCKSHQVTELYAFGSVVTEQFTDQSDVDLLIGIDEADPVIRGHLLLSIWNKLEQYFDRKVDLLTPDSLKNSYLIKSIESTKQLIYDGSKEEVL